MANVKISSLSTLSGSAVAGNDLFLLTQTSNSASRSLSVSNARIAISDANDYITYNILSSEIANVANTTETSVNLVQYNLSSYSTSVSSNIFSVESNLNSRLNIIEANLSDYASNVSSNTNLVQSNLDSFAAYANLTFSTGGGGSGSGDSNSTLEYVFANYVTTSSNSYYIGTSVSSVNNVQVFIEGVYQSKNSYILSNASSNIQFLDSIIEAGKQLNLETMHVVNINGINTSVLESNVLSLQSGLVGSNAEIVSVRTDLNSYANYANTLLSNSGSGSADIVQNNLIAYALNVSSNINSVQSNLVSYSSYANTTIATKDSIANVYATYINIKTGLDSANSIINTKDSIANVYATYLSAMSNDSATISNAFSNDYLTYTTLYSYSTNLQSGLSGTNSKLASNIATFTGAFIGSNLKISGLESNVLSLQNSVSGSNVSIINLQTGIAGTNSLVSAITASPIIFESDVSVRGNLFLLASNATSITANSITTEDSLIYLAANNIVSDIVDIGFLAHYYNGSNSHTGLIRSAITKDYYLFQGYDKEEPDNTVDINDASFKLANIRLGVAHTSNLIVANSDIIVALTDNVNSLRSNDYTTYLTIKSGLDASNTSIINLQSGLVGSNSIINTKDSIANVYATYLIAKGGIDSANSIINTKDSIANVYTTWAYLNANINAISSYANSTFATQSNTAQIANAIHATKTFNITGSFSGPITGTARYIPINAFTILKAQMLNSSEVSANLVIQLNKNGNSISTFTLVSGSYVQNFSNLNYTISTSDYLTVDIISGSGNNFSFTISN